MYALIELDEYVWPKRVTVFTTFEKAEDAVHTRMALRGQELVHTNANTAQMQYFTEAESYNSYLIMEVK
jgi:hypothetical protein